MPSVSMVGKYILVTVLVILSAAVLFFVLQGFAVCLFTDGSLIPCLDPK